MYAVCLNTSNGTCVLMGKDAARWRQPHNLTYILEAAKLSTVSQAMSQWQVRANGR